jgi:hypothetical protein
MGEEEVKKMLTFIAIITLPRTITFTSLAKFFRIARLRVTSAAGEIFRYAPRCVNKKDLNVASRQSDKMNSTHVKRFLSCEAATQ